MILQVLKVSEQNLVNWDSDNRDVLLNGTIQYKQILQLICKWTNGMSILLNGANSDFFT